MIISVVDSFEPGRIAREMTSAIARSRSRPAGLSSAASPGLPAIAATTGTCRCVSDRVIVTACPGRPPLASD